MKRHIQNDEHEQDYLDAANARIGADRMAAGLPCLPDRVSGDLGVVLDWQRACAELHQRIDNLKRLLSEEGYDGNVDFL